MKAYKCRICLRASEGDKTIKVSNDFGWCSNFEYSVEAVIEASCSRAWQDMPLLYC